MSTGAREVRAQAPTLGMAVRAEGALLAAESHWLVWERSSYILLLLWSGKDQCFIYVLYCNFQTQSKGMWHKSAVVQNLIWLLPCLQDDKENTQLRAWESSHSMELISNCKGTIFCNFDQVSCVFRQVRNDYLCADHVALDQDVAVQLCCLEIRYFFKDMPQIALDKKSNLEYLEKEVTL